MTTKEAVFRWLQEDDGYWIFEDRKYAVGTKKVWRNLSRSQQEANYVCVTRTAEIATLLCSLLNGEKGK